MKAVGLRCPHCGAVLNISPRERSTVCEYCGSTVYIDGLAEPLHAGNEKTEIHASINSISLGTDAAANWQTGQQTKKKSRMWLWILEWIFIFPVPLTILILRNKKLKPMMRYGLVAVIWIMFFAIGSSDPDKTASNKPQEKYVSETEAEQNIVEERTVPEEVQDEDTRAVSQDEAEKDKIEAESILIEGDEVEDMAIGKTVELSAAISPENAEDKVIIWSSSDTNVATVDENGKVTAVSGGEAVISASSSNGKKDSRSIYVDESKCVMKLRASYERDDDNNIGDEWSHSIELDDEKVGWEEEIVVSEGESLNCYARFTEEDKYPDVGEASTSYTVTKDDLDEGFDIEMDVYVTENGGRNSGKSAHFVVTYEFTPIEF